MVRDSWFVKVTPLTGRHFYMGAVHRLGEKLVLYINRVNIDAGRVRTYKSLWIQVNPCVPPASGRVPKGQEGRTMVFIGVICQISVWSQLRYSGLSPVPDMFRQRL